MKTKLPKLEQQRQMTVPIAFGILIQQNRERIGLPRWKLARMVGEKTLYLNRIEHGLIKTVLNLDLFFDICKALNRVPSSMMRDIEDMMGR